jgi:glucose/arabinose dehydrogenase
MSVRIPFFALSAGPLAVPVLLGALGAVPAAAQSGGIAFKDAFPGTKFSDPVYFGAFPGRPNTNVVLEQHAANVLLVYAKPDGSLAKDTLYHLSVGQDLEQGLLGIAFHPDFATNRKYYISYDPPGSTYYDVVEERLADATGMKDSGTPGRILFNIDDPFVNHNGGNLAFGPKDGYLYYAVGDGGSANDPYGNGQNKNAWLGKMHRIDVNSKDAGLEYHIPADNPFAGGGGRAEIYAYGLRNPWRWNFDPLTGELWEGDVGQDAVEEVNLLAKGGNYGWKAMEGDQGTNDGTMLLPLYSYTHASISGAGFGPNGPAIIGGVVFRANPASKYYGTYFFADWGSKAFWNLKYSAPDSKTITALNPSPASISSFGTDAQGRIYACGYYNGTIYLLDSPDLVPAAGLRPGLAGPGLSGRTYAAAPGGRLDPRAFARAPVLDLFDLSGSRRGSLRRDDARLPAGLPRGLYVLKAADGASDLLAVR